MGNYTLRRVVVANPCGFIPLEGWIEDRMESGLTLGRSSWGLDRPRTDAIPRHPKCVTQRGRAGMKTSPDRLVAVSWKACRSPPPWRVSSSKR